MPIYRCDNCGNEAEHATPKCVPCGLDPKADPRDAASLTELQTIHFDPPHATVKGRGLGVAACDPKLRVGAPACVATGERAHVTCPKCKAAPAYAAAEGVAVGPSEAMRLGPVSGPPPLPAE